MLVVLGFGTLVCLETKYHYVTSHGNVNIRVVICMYCLEPWFVRPPPPLHAEAYRSELESLLAIPISSECTKHTHANVGVYTIEAFSIRIINKHELSFHSETSQHASHTDRPQTQLFP